MQYEDLEPHTYFLEKPKDDFSWEWVHRVYDDGEFEFVEASHLKNLYSGWYFYNTHESDNKWKDHREGNRETRTFKEISVKEVENIILANKI